MAAWHPVSYPYFGAAASIAPGGGPSLGTKAMPVPFSLKFGFLSLPLGTKKDLYVPNKQMKETKAIALQQTPTTDLDDHTLDLSDLQRRLDADTDIESLASCLKDCSDSADLVAGERVHACIISDGYESERYLENFLILMYANCCEFEAAQIAFHKIDRPNVYSWNIFINACAINGRVNEAKIVFDKMPRRNVASWNAIIAAYSQHGFGNEALQLYGDMLDGDLIPDKITFVSAIDACAGLAALIEGMLIHSSVISRGYLTDVVIGTSLMYMYSKCGDLETAGIIFEQIMGLDSICWNAMIEACIENNCYLEAFTVFGLMQQTGLELTRPAFLGVLDACANLAQLAKGLEFHSHIVFIGLDLDIMVQNSLINMYSKCNSLDEAMSIFCKMPCRDEVTWSTIIAAYEADGQDNEAMDLFQQMQLESVSPNKFTFSTILDVCAHQSELAEGQKFHINIVSTGTEFDVVLEVALINMYGKCGSLDDARAVFDRRFELDIRSWNTKIRVFVLRGHDRDAMALFNQMQSKGVLPNESTFKLIHDTKLIHT